MTGTEESIRPGDLFDAARRTALQHARGGCFHCTCAQNTWALEELRRHPGGQQVLDEIRQIRTRPS
ncbi:hypothetical protein [Micromonospora sp. RV43]|uniref:hypothetical protein n=1 Tax=Micromonospora sp. RV43 TaxID=1661387 RepID=UPI00064C3021|nr:hypothetical protein [Micromonospora sp. RV43]